MMVGFDPDALARLRRQWKARCLDSDPIVAEQWATAVHELSLVILVSPQAPGAVPNKVFAVDPQGSERPPERLRAPSLDFSTTSPVAAQAGKIKSLRAMGSLRVITTVPATALKD